MKTAVKPDFFSNFTVQKQTEGKPELTDDEKALFALTESRGFYVFTTLKDNLLKSMDTYIDASIAQGKSKEEIGENAILISWVKGIVNRLWSYTEDSKEACEQPAGGK